MKIIYKVIPLCIMVLISSFSTQAQILTSNRQNYFYKYADQLPTATSELEKIFTKPEGAKVKINFDNFSFNGIVTSSIKRYDNLYSVVIKAPGLDNTILAISKRINNDRTISYVGHIINRKYADGFELKESNGNYSMNKVRTDALIEDY